MHIGSKMACWTGEVTATGEMDWTNGDNSE